MSLTSHFKARMTPEVHAALSKLAASNNRSINSEILVALQNHIAAGGENLPGLDRDTAEEIVVRLARIERALNFKDTDPVVITLPGTDAEHIETLKNILAGLGIQLVIKGEADEIA